MYAADGLVARESGAWARNKLHYLQRYFYAFNQATKKHFPTRVYVDLMAGPGRCRLRDEPEIEFDGSPILALSCESPFSRVICVERDKDCRAALQARAQSANSTAALEILGGDCNDPNTIDHIRGALARRGTLGLIFVDTLGLGDVQFESLRRLTDGVRADLVYTFHVQDVNRNIRRARDHADEGERFRRAFGTSDWQSAWEQHLQGVGTAVTFGDALSEFFERQLRDQLSYPHVTSLHRLMKNSKGAPLYRLILSSHSDLAPRLWRKVSTVDDRGQRDLPLPMA